MIRAVRAIRAETATRLAATVHGDARLQLRQGFYYAAAFVLVVLIAVGRQLPADVLEWVLPVIVLSNVQINTFYFLAGLVLLEKGEGTLQAQVVTPLRPGEYLASKVVTLTVLSVVENIALVLATLGPATLLRGGLVLLVGIVLASLLFCFSGLLAVARHDSINEFLMPSFLYTLVLTLPLLPYFGLLASPLFDLHPMQAPLALLRQCFDRGPAPSLLALASCAAGTAIAARLSLRAFHRFVVNGTGDRR